MIMLLSAGLKLSQFSRTRFVINRLAFSSTANLKSSNRLFTEKHEWIMLKDEQKVGRVGISEHAQESLGDVVYVQMPDVGSSYSQFDEVGAIESVKAASELLTPVSGEIKAINSKLEEKPSLVNSDCYGEGWLFDIKLDDAKQLDKLMSEKQYRHFLEGEKAT